MKERKQEDTKKDEKIHQELENYKKKLEEYTNDLKRLQAEFENYKKRQEKENSHFMEYSNAKLISRLLVLLDDFDSCLKNIKESDEHSQGLLMLHKKMLNILESEGLREIDTNSFDPYKHEVILVVESNSPDGEIIEVIQKGYMIKDKVLRSAKVAISKHMSEVKQNDNGKKA